MNRRPLPSSSTSQSPTKKPPLRTQKSSPGLRTQASSSTTVPPVPSTPAKSGLPTLRPKASTSKLRVNPPTQSRARSTSPTKPPPSPTKSISSRYGRTATPKPKAPPSPEPPRTPMAVNIREQIALKRAEAKKAAMKNAGTSDGIAISWVGETPNDKNSEDGEREEDELGRISVKDTIDRARTSGSLNLSARYLTALPASLFVMHLGIEPAPLASQPKETEKKHPELSSVSWYEAVDLTILKARDNEIVELQPEIALFGSLKVIDFHSNKLHSLPAQFSELISLTHLDLSSNSFTSLPQAITQLPSLHLLNLSRNSLQSIVFGPSSPTSATPSSPAHPLSFYAPTRERGDKPLQSLQILLLSENKLTGNSIDVTHLPEGLTKADLAQNPLGSSSNRLLGALGKLTKLKELSLHACQLSDSALPSSSAKPPFQKLESLDLGDNEDVTDARIRLFLNGRTISFGVETIDETGSLVKVISGKKIVKEAWEIEAERRGRGGRSITPASAMRSNTKSPSSPPAGPVVKEQWEIDAEQGLTTAAGRLRAKMAGQGKALLSSTPENEATTSSSSTADVTPPSAPQVASLTKYYTASHASLSLPSSLPPSKKGLLHSRSVSLSHSVNGPPLTDPAVPRQTLPLSIILAQQPWGATLRVLELSNRRADVCFLLGSQGLKGGLGRLEELKMDGCNLGDEVRCVVEKDGGGKEEMKSRLLDTLKELFPSLTVLDLSYNVITSLSGIEEMFFPPSSPGQGLKALRVRGNKISDIRPLEAIAERFERAGGAGVGVEGWKGEEIDLRENEVGKLLPILGLLPLDIFLVEGNLFRVPGRRVWERDGTKGLLKWLKDSL